MDTIICYIATLVVSFLISYFMVPVSIKFANKYGILDNPKADNRRVHKVPTPRVGGIAMVTAVMVTVIVYNIIRCIMGLGISSRFIGYVIGGILIILMGFIDDVFNLKPLYKFLFQILAATAIYVFEIRIAGVKIPFIHASIIDFGIFSFPITVLWVLGITNAVNLIDGLDGLAAGISTISSIALLTIFAISGAGIEAIIIGLALLGSTLGFLPYNFNPAKTFMGDVGSNFLGYTLATISIIGMAKGYTILAIVAPLIVVGVPVFDMVFALVRRLAHHQSIMAPDKGHIHHRLLRCGFTQRQAVLILYGITTFLGVIAVTIVSGRLKQGVICLVIAILLWFMAYMSKGISNRKFDVFEKIFSKHKIEENDENK